MPPRDDEDASDEVRAHDLGDGGLATMNLQLEN
jgi:hypothetical protein